MNTTSNLTFARPPPKIVLLALCASALRFGPTRTLLVAATCKLSVDVVEDLRQRIQHRLAGWRGAREAESGRGRRTE